VTGVDAISESELARLDALGKRNEQKAKFNRMGRETARAGG
jgi:hypothetical protein